MEKYSKKPNVWAAAADQAAPAGAAARAPVGQQTEGGIAEIILACDRDRRTLAWLREEVGDVAIIDATSRLAGNRKLFVSNIAKVLGVKVPDRLAVTDSTTAQQHTSRLLAKLRT